MVKDVETNNESGGKRGKPLTSKKRRGVYLLPNLITSASLLGGFYSIVAAFDGKYEIAAIVIIISGFLDGLDGRVARLTGTSTKFGEEYDSLSDVVAFGIAPGVLIFTWALRPFGKYGWIAASLFVLSGALRLARFNVQTETTPKNYFKGLPIPMGAGLVASTVLFLMLLGVEQSSKHIPTLALVYIVSYLMISNVKYYSFRELSPEHRMPFRILVGLIFLLLLVVAEPAVMLFVLSMGYALSGPIAGLVILLRKRFGKGSAEVENPVETPKP